MTFKLSKRVCGTLFQCYSEEKDEIGLCSICRRIGEHHSVPHTPLPHSQQSVLQGAQFEMADLGNLVFKVTFSVDGEIVYSGDISELHLIFILCLRTRILLFNLYNNRQMH